jgi:hypothetical protein
MPSRLAPIRRNTLDIPIPDHRFGLVSTTLRAAGARVIAGKYSSRQAPSLVSSYGLSKERLSLLAEFMMAEIALSTQRTVPIAKTAQRGDAMAPSDDNALGHAPHVAALTATARLLNARPQLAAQRVTSDTLNAGFLNAGQPGNADGTSPTVTQLVKRGGRNAPASLSAAFTSRHVAGTDAARETAFNTRLAANHNLGTNTTATATSWKAAINGVSDNIPGDVGVTVYGVDTTQAAGVFTHTAIADINKTVTMVANGLRGSKAIHVGG